MERNICDIFEYFGTTLEVVENKECDDCYFYHDCMERLTHITGLCAWLVRSDKKKAFLLRKLIRIKIVWNVKLAKSSK